MFDANLLEGKTIIITGGGSGLGKSMARRFGELGANLVIASRREEVLQSAAEELRETGAEVQYAVCDVREPGDVAAMVETAKSSFGRIDVLLNNAAGNFISPTENLSTGGFKVIVDIVLMGTFNCTLAVGKEMIENGDASISEVCFKVGFSSPSYFTKCFKTHFGMLPTELKQG